MGDYRFASASKGHPSNHQRATRDGAVQDRAHSVSRKEEEELDKPLDSVPLSELCSSEGFTGGLLGTEKEGDGVFDVVNKHCQPEMRMSV